MTPKTVYAIVVFISVFPGNFQRIPNGDRQKNNLQYLMDTRLNFTELTARNGYRADEHSVVTEDGYILTLHRIVHSRRCKDVKKQTPVILMHGLLLNSDAWLDAGPDAALAYLLSDACHDVWVGNQRGNYYARRHKHLEPDDPRFWKFSVDEIGYYDIPATIDYVLDHTEAKKLNYIGYSQGSGTFYVMCSERPGYCDKVQLLISLAPATRHLNTKAVGFRALCQLVEGLQDDLKESRFYSVLNRGGATQQLLLSLCQSETSSEGVCSVALAFFDALNPGSITAETYRVLFEHFPSGTSVQNLVRYSQSIRSVDFVKFDYGMKKNLKVYGNVLPPPYNLSAVTVPVVVIYGRNDGIVDPEDVKWLVRRLPNVLESFEVNDPLWSHFDNIYSQHIVDMTFPKIKKYLSLYDYGGYTMKYSYF